MKQGFLNQSLETYLQFGGGSRVISASSFWILLADVDNAFDPKDLAVRSLERLSRSRSDAAAVVEELEEDILISVPGRHSQKALIIDPQMAKLTLIVNVKIRRKAKTLILPTRCERQSLSFFLFTIFFYSFDGAVERRDAEDEQILDEGKPHWPT